MDLKQPCHVEALLFDVGGVVLDIDFERAFRSWEPISRISLQEIRRRFSMDGPYEQHERGEICAAEYFDHLREVLELEGGDANIAQRWNAIYVREIKETKQYILSAKRKLPCFAFTNSNPTHQAVWTAAYPGVVGAFDRIFVSSDLGLRKPERAAFEKISKIVGVDTSAILFFDDMLENVEGARAAGLRAVHVRTPLDVKRALVPVVSRHREERSDAAI